MRKKSVVEWLIWVSARFKKMTEWVWLNMVPRNCDPLMIVNWIDLKNWVKNLLPEESWKGFLQVRFARFAAHVGEVAGVSTFGHAVPTSTPVELVVEVKRVARSMKVIPIGSPARRISSVDLGIDEVFGGVIRSVQQAKLRRFDVGSRVQTMTSAGCVTRETGLSEKFAMDGQCASFRQIGPSGSLLKMQMSRCTALKFDSSGEIFAAFEVLPSQSAKILLEDVFELNPRTVDSVRIWAYNNQSGRWSNDTVHEGSWFGGHFGARWIIRGLVVACTKRWQFGVSWAVWPFVFPQCSRIRGGWWSGFSVKLFAANSFWSCAHDCQWRLCPDSWGPQICCYCLGFRVVISGGR